MTARDVTLIRARPRHLSIVAAILAEAGAWADEQHGELWSEAELDEARILEDIDRGEFFLARLDGNAAATIRYQLVDAQFWPDVKVGDAAYVHRLAVRRCYAGRGLAAAMLDWAAARARSQGLTFLRLDADLTRPKLRSLYERCGFREHSERQVGPYHVMRYERRVG